MFFSITKQIQPNFPYNHQTKNFVISLDEGWEKSKDLHGNDIWYKGYLDHGNLKDHVSIIAYEEYPTYSGNFCIIKIFDQGIAIRTDRLRSFPIYYSSLMGLSNLINLGETYWTDSVITINNDLSILHSKFDAVGQIDDSILDFESVVNQVDTILKKKTLDFVGYLNAPIRVFLSGGIDTSLLYSYIQKYANDNFELVPYEHRDFDYFYLKNHRTLSKMWAYTQIHHWKEPCVLSSGAPGDEFTLRSPTTANLMLLHYGTSIPELLEDKKFQDSLHSFYFNKESCHKIWQKQKDEYIQSTLHDIIKTCCEYNSNDWQHWHLGNTLTWTPLRDLSIFKLIARLPIDDLKNQIMNSAVQVELIKRNNPTILNYLSTKKNFGNSLENLTNLYT